MHITKYQNYVCMFISQTILKPIHHTDILQYVFEMIGQIRLDIAFDDSKECEAGLRNVHFVDCWIEFTL